MRDDNLAANEQALANSILEYLGEITADDFDIVLKHRLQLDEASEFRRLHIDLECRDADFANLIGHLAAQLNVLQQSDNIAKSRVDLECSIPDILIRDTSLPDDYPKVFSIRISSTDQMGREDDNLPLPDLGIPAVAPENPAITLLLSGGGFRATLFHLGAIQHLRQSGKLGFVKEVFSVSGGSILAAHLATHWSDYTGDDRQFDRAASEVVKFTQGGLRESIVRKYILVWMSMVLLAIVYVLGNLYFFNASAIAWIAAVVGFFAIVGFCVYLENVWRPINSLQRGYLKLFGKAALHEIDADAPDFYFLSTNLTTGNISCFAKQGIYYDLDSNQSLDDQRLISTETSTFAEAVAASSAFPPMFSPFPIDPKKWQLDNNVLAHCQYLTDGGVYDNLAVRACKLMSQQRGEVFVSDAERKFDSVVGNTFRWLPGRTTRSTDILMHRVNDLEFELLESEADAFDLARTFESVKFARLQTDHEQNANADYQSLSPDIKRRVRKIRTDLDAFSDFEIQLLYSSGLIAARFADGQSPDLGEGVFLAENGVPAVTNGGGWLPIKTLPQFTSAQLLQHLEQSARNRPRLWRFSSVVCWLGLLCALAILLLNPLSLSFIRSIPVKPGNFNGHELFPAEADFDEKDTHYSMLTSYTMEAMNAATNQNLTSRPIKIYFLESKRLSDLTFPFASAGFPFQLKANDLSGEIFFANAFLIYSESTSLSNVQRTSDSPPAFFVRRPESGAKIVVIVGISFDSESEANAEISASQFEFITGDPDVAIQ